ncbi:NADH:flavin oxidoreductase [Shewanella mangrovi]|uniref:NADH:flavin oxidoreductase n=1 Tax=Shewanella mangrovi TaxID=1515746 RepID=A0A094JXU1_9GAMM|nr:alkene reductase [Shewanella mangrovi]KFZ37251.1 NADH:flavin oxidoreductase [Shewanella mangrovi]
MQLLQPYDFAGQQLANRIAMAPMTRARATEGKPDALTAEYYAQRASAGLLITEGLPISAQGTGYLYTPGIYTAEQLAAWQPVTAAVHQNGGKIFAQLWHVGRVSHHSIQPDNGAPVSSSGTAGGQAFAYDEQGNPANVPASQPEALTLEGIAQVINDFRQAAANAIAAGFDGVELHAANGYLIEQFINPILNERDDLYGGNTLENRSRLLLEVVDAVVLEIGAEKVGVRLSPFNRIGDMPLYHDIAETYLHIVEELDHYSLAYLHIALTPETIDSGLLAHIRQQWHGTLMIAGGINAAQAEQFIADKRADVIAFGSAFIANPDLVERIAHHWPLAEVQRSSFYGGGAAGYTDYPRYQDTL